MSRGKLIEIGQVEAEGGDAARRLADIDAVQALTQEPHQLLRLLVVAGSRISLLPLLRYPVEQADQEDPRATGRIKETAFPIEGGNPFQGRVENDLGEEPRRVECPGLFLRAFRNRS